LPARNPLMSASALHVSPIHPPSPVALRTQGPYVSLFSPVPQTLVVKAISSSRFAEKYRLACQVGGIPSRQLIRCLLDLLQKNQTRAVDGKTAGGRSALLPKASWAIMKLKPDTGVSTGR